MELPPEAVALCLSAGTALVGSMATDAWSSVRAIFGRFLSENGELVREARLDRDREALVAASGGEREALAERTAASWAVRLEDIVESRPEAAADLAALVKDLELKLGSTSKGIDNSRVRQKADNGGVNIFSGRDTRF